MPTSPSSTDRRVPPRPAPAPLPAPTHAPRVELQPGQKSNTFKWLLVGSLVFVLLGGAALLGAAWFGMRKLTQYGYDSELAQRHPELIGIVIALKNDAKVDNVQVDKIKGIVTYRQKATGRTLRFYFVDGKLRHESVDGTPLPDKNDDDETSDNPAPAEVEPALRRVNSI